MKKLLAVFIVSLFITACASSTQIAQPLSNKSIGSNYYSTIEVKDGGTKAPEHFMVAVKSYLKQELVNQAQFSEQNGHQIEIIVTDYRMRSGFTRAMFGMLAGKYGIDSIVIIKNPKTGEVLGRSTVSSFNIMAVGGMEDIAKMHAEEIVKFLNSKEG